jgi:hypothetical protein
MAETGDGKSFDFKPKPSPAGQVLRTIAQMAGVVSLVLLFLTMIGGPVVGILFAGAFVVYCVTRGAYLVWFDPASRFSLRSLILMTFFMGSMVGYVVAAHRVDRLPGGDDERRTAVAFLCVIVFLLASIVSLIVDRRRMRALAEKRREEAAGEERSAQG